MFEAACCISACERRTRATSIYLQCNAGIAQIDLFPTLLPMKLGENLELVEDFKSHAHTHTRTHVSNVHPTHCSPRHTSQGHLASCCANVLLTWATLGGWAKSPGRRLWNMLKANLLKFLRVAFFNVLSWTCRLALWNPRTYCRAVLCVCTQPIIVSIQLHAHNTHNHEHPPSSPLGISVQYLWQSFGWNKTGQKWSKHLRTSSLPLRTFWDPSRLQELHVGGRQGIAALRRVRLAWSGLRA